MFGYIKDIRAIGFKDATLGFLFYNNFAVAVKRLFICKRKGHLEDGYGYCLNCWRTLPICDECGLSHDKDI